VYIAKEVDMTGVTKNSFGEWDERQAGGRGIQIVGDVVEEWRKKTYELFDKPRKTIAFSAGVDHGKEFRKAVAERRI
jgi:hypothetical protein